MAVFESTGWDIEDVLIGQTLVRQWNIYSDDGFQVPMDLTGYTFEVVLQIPSFGENNPVTLTEGSGLTVQANPGIISMSTPTTTWPRGRGRWYMQATDNTGAVSYPLRGILSVGNP